jgi:hypothetical protein
MKVLFFTFAYVRSIVVNLIKVGICMHVQIGLPWNIDHRILPQVYFVSTLLLLRKFNCGDDAWVVT